MNRKPRHGPNNSPHKCFRGKQKLREPVCRSGLRNVREYCSESLNEAIDYAKGCSEVTTTEQFLEMLNDVLKYVPRSIVACYKGEHDSEDHSGTPLCCLTDDKIQWSKSHLPTSMTEKIEMTEEDECNLLHIIDMRLGPHATAATFRNTNTQTNEAVNRGLSKTNPKNVTTFYRAINILSLRT